MSGIFDTILMDECIASAKFLLKIRTTDADLYLSDIANTSLSNMGALSTVIPQQCVLDIEDRKSTIPCGYSQIISLTYGDKENNNCSELLYADLDFLRDCGCTTAWNWVSYNGYFQIEDNHIFYHQIPNSQTTATLNFLGANVDKNGHAVIYERYKECVTAYICYIFSLQNQDEVQYRGQWQQHYAMFKAKKRQIIGDDVKNKFRNEKHQIRSIMNAWISDKRNWRTI